MNWYLFIFFQMWCWLQILSIWLGFYVGCDIWVKPGIRNMGVDAVEING